MDNKAADDVHDTQSLANKDRNEETIYGSRGSHALAPLSVGWTCSASRHARPLQTCLPNLPTHPDNPSLRYKNHAGKRHNGKIGKNEPIGPISARQAASPEIPLAEPPLESDNIGAA
jgi:hypothetical protein